MTDGADTSPALGISVNAVIDEGRSIVFQTHIPQEASLEDINKLLDTAMQAADRQEARYKLRREKETLEQTEKQLVMIKEDFKRISDEAQERFTATGRKGEFRLSPNEKQAKQNAMVTVQRYEKAVADHKAKIDHYQRIVDGG